MSARRASTRVLSMLLVLCMVIGLMPMAAFAAETDTLAASLEEAKAFVDALTINNSKNDPKKVVTTVGTHFSWDNEKRENGKDYLYEWSYYNGVVFEGLDYVYDVTGETVYYDYVKEYLDAMITDGKLNSYAGYVNYHGADCYKTASLLLDYYKLTGDDKYRSVAKELYGHLTNVETQAVTKTGYTKGTELLSNAGNNFGHTWASPSSPELWLDGLYMILPFRAEYAAYTGDTDELDQIVSRLTWVSENMYNKDKGLFYHAANSATDNSGSYWLRSIGWYAAAIVDVMDSMSGDNFTAMQKQLVKLVDGMKACQNASNGMWLNNMAASKSSSNPYETSGTALVCYAVMKAVNNGWLDDSYADMALLAFNGICNEKLDGDTLTDICFKGAPGSSNSTFYDNEGKGVGPFIMLYAEVLEYYNKEVVSISVTAPTKTEYEVGEELNLDGMTVSATTRGGRTYAVTGYTVSEVDMSEAGTKTVTVTYGDLTASFEITVVEPETEAPTEAPTEPEETEPEETEPEVTEPEETEPEVTEPEVVTKEDTETGVSVSAAGITGLTVTAKEATDTVGETGKTIADVVAEVLVSDNLTVYDITVENFTEGGIALVNVPVPADMDVNEFGVYYVADDGSVERMPGVPVDESTYQFATTHFSIYVGGEETDGAKVDQNNSVSGEGNVVGTTTYKLDTDGVTANKKYLIASGNSGTVNVLTNNNGTAASTAVETDGNNTNNRTITVTDDTNIAWVFSGTNSGTVGNNGRYVYPNNGFLSLNEDDTSLTISNQSNGAYRIYRYDGDEYYYYLRYYDNRWTGSRTDRKRDMSSVYLYEYNGTNSGAKVTFSASPAKTSMKPRDTQDITYEIIREDRVVIGDYDITWNTSNPEVATVEKGVITAVGSGTATITATLNSVTPVTGKIDKLDGSITLELEVTVQGKELNTNFEPKLTGNNPVTTKVGVEPNFSNIKLEVLFQGDKETSFITVENGLIIEDYDVSEPGYSYATISYNGQEYGTVRVTVEGNPYEEKEDATDYPEYPADGAVRIGKTATEVDFDNTGVVQVELDVAGVSTKSAVDVILVTDLSNSMAWEAGGRTDATSHRTTKVYGLQQSVAAFADIFLAADDEGNATKNTVSLVTFGGYDADYTNKVYTDYADPTKTLLLGSSDANAVKSTINDIRVLADDALNIGTSTTGYYLSFDGGKTYGENYGNTNYDHAFMQTADAIAELKAAYKTANGIDYDASGRQIYILFMTDGAPSNYNGVYYNYKTGDRADVNSTWLNEDGEEDTYVMGINRAQYQEGPWFQYIAGGTYNASTGTIPGNPLYWADQVYNTTGVADIYSVGFDLDNGGFSSMTFTLADGRPLSKVLEKLVTGQTLEIYSADDEAGLSKIYSDLATKIRYAGTQANVSDVIGSHFTLQLTQSTGTGTEADSKHGDLGFMPTITIKAYELWTKEETSDVNLIGTRKTDGDGNQLFTEIETVKFNENGTEATSNLKTGNIMSTASDGTVTIDAFYFTYTKTPEGVESFKWNIGNITDKEIALSFYAYLKGSMEGEDPKGLYYTNEEATLEYIDINDKHATQTFPIPGVAWGGASTAYEFYLVNDKGQPCDRNGNVIPFANRVIITGPFYEELYLNQAGEYVSKDIVAAYVLPAGYTLYDETAKYTVMTASGSGVGKLEISEPAAGKVQTTKQVYPALDSTDKSFIQSRVAFGVLYNKIPTVSNFQLTPDQVVIDYGKSIVIDVFENNTNLESGYTAELVGFSRYYASVDLKTKFSSTSAEPSYNAPYGTFSIENAAEGTVRYAPTAIVNGVEKIFCVVKMHNAVNNDTYYMVDWLTVIPATIMYYETDFATGVFTTETTGPEWNLKATVTDDNAADGPQDYKVIGTDLYGYDSTYENDKYLSNGSSLFVQGQGIKLNENATSYTYAQFSFTGTGFDLISRTGEFQGAIRVDIYKDQARTDRAKSVTVLNKSESKWELYQIPVVSVNDLPHGTYYVTIGVNAAYSNTTYPQLNRGGEFYFDAIRVYEPIIASASAAAGSDAAVAYAAYVADGELNPQIVEVRNVLLDAKNFNSAGVGGIVFGEVVVDRPETKDGTVQSNVEVGTYETIGPNNEVYLKNGQAISFNVETGVTIPKTFNIGAKSVNGEPVILQATIFMNGKQVNEVTNTAITSSTIQFFTLFKEGQAAPNTDYQVVITNTGTGVLSITDLKFAGSSAANDVEIYSDEASVEQMKHVLVYGVPKVEEEPETPDFGVVSAEFSAETAKRGDTVNMVINTSADVAEVAVLNANGSKLNIEVISVTEVDGQKVWTVSFTLTSAGTQTFTAVGYKAAGETGTTADATIKVNNR